MLLYYLLALLAAFCWALASLISADISRSLGGIGFNRIRLIIVSIMLITYSYFDKTLFSINTEFLFTIIISGIIGVFLGDTLLFLALQRIGPRRNNILFALAAPFTIILNIIILNEQMNLLEFSGCLFVFMGVVIAIAYGTKKNEHRWEKVEGSIKIGVFLGILAAFCQAMGLIIIKPVLNEGADPIATAAIRTSISAFLLSFTYFSNSKIFNTGKR